MQIYLLQGVDTPMNIIMKTIYMTMIVIMENGTLTCLHIHTLWQILV